VPAVDELKRCGRGGLVVALLDLPQADIIDDQEIRSGPTLRRKDSCCRQAGEEVVEQVDKRV